MVSHSDVLLFCRSLQTLDASLFCSMIVTNVSSPATESASSEPIIVQYPYGQIKNHIMYG